MSFTERTDEEIIARIQSVEASGLDWLGTERTDLLIRLPFDKARLFLEEGVNEADWKQLPRDRDSILAEAKDYMSFAWEKANNERGISAGRSMNHYSAWMWLISEDFGDLNNYRFYGKPHLVAICDRFGWDSGQRDDGERSNG